MTVMTVVALVGNSNLGVQTGVCCRNIELKKFPTHSSDMRRDHSATAPTSDPLASVTLEAPKQASCPFNICFRPIYGYIRLGGRFDNG